jgi:hypothetical protein
MYDQMPDQHTPLMPVLLSLVAPFFSEGWRAARAVLVLLLSLTTALTYASALRLGGRIPAIVAAGMFACWSVTFGFGKLWHESFLTPLYLLLFLLDAPVGTPGGRRRLAALGLVGGLAFLVKQTAAEVIAAVVLWHLVKSWRERVPLRRQVADLVILGGATLAPAALYVVFHLSQGGTLEALWFWVFTFNRDSGFVTMAALAPSAADLLALAPAYLLVPAAAWSALALLRAGDIAWHRYAYAALLLVATSGGVFPRYAAFHLAPSLPFIAWMSGMVVGRLWQERQVDAGDGTRGVGVPVAVGVLLLWAFIGGTTYARASSATARPIEEYTDVQPLAAAMRPHIAPGDSVYVFPDDEATANVYHLLDSPPPRYWMFHYPWYLTPSVSARVLDSVISASPTWIIHQGDPWGVEPLVPGVFSYLRSHYDVVATVQWNMHEVRLLRRNALKLAE